MEQTGRRPVVVWQSETLLRALHAAGRLWRTTPREHAEGLVRRGPLRWLRSEGNATMNGAQRQFGLVPPAIAAALVASYGCSGDDEALRAGVQEARLHIPGYRLLRVVSQHEVKTKADFDKAMAARAQANEERREGRLAPEANPLDKLSREELAEAFRGRSFADGREYEEVDPNYQVADLLVAARKSPNASHLDLDRAPESVIG